MKKINDCCTNMEDDHVCLQWEGNCKLEFCSCVRIGFKQLWCSYLLLLHYSVARCVVKCTSQALTDHFYVPWFRYMNLYIKVQCFSKFRNYTAFSTVVHKLLFILLWSTFPSFNVLFFCKHALIFTLGFGVWSGAD